MEVSEVVVDPRQAAETAKVDFNFLGALVMAQEFLFAFPSFYLTLFGMLTNFAGKIQRFAIGIPRGFAKTTFIKILCVWYVLFSGKHFILIVSASEKKAIAIVADICDMLSSPNIRRLFGHWDANVEVDQAATKVFHFRGREIVLWAAGAQTSVRGINRKNKRPDVMIMDDIQEREDAENPDLAEALLLWMLSTLMKARSPFGCTYIFVGNMYPRNSILAKLKSNPQWTSLIVGGILADGSSLWEELKPIDELIEEYESDTAMGHPEVFISEVLNSTDVALSSGIDPAKIALLPEYLATEDEGEGGFIIIDPSGFKQKSDDCTMSHWEVKDGYPIFDELIAGVFNPLDTIKNAIEMGFRRNTRAIFVEDTAYQASLLFWFEKYCETAELNGIGVIEGFVFLPVSPKGVQKTKRIKTGYTMLVPDKEDKVKFYLHPNVRSLVIAEYMDWNPLKTNNKDNIIDPIGYAEEVMREYPEHILRDLFNTSTQEPVRASNMETMALPF